MSLDPVQIGQALAGIIIAGATCVLTIRQGLKRWGEKWRELQAADRKTQTTSNTRALRNALRKELRGTLREEIRTVLAEQMKSFTARLERLEHAVEGNPIRRTRAARSALRRQTATIRSKS